ncbi:MAG TPA: TIR domain-containing protein [Steroidobacteraceae bacterium]
MTAGTVFLSYASQDAAAAHRIATALTEAGIEVWFDQSELRGGDAWDAMIRSQIKACTLFLPIISASAHARVEGYFRLEWKLAVDRSHLMAPDQPFLLPVVIDDTAQNDERIPERFREIQWSRLRGGYPSADFVARILRLLSRARTESPGTARSTPPGTPAGSAISTPRPRVAMLAVAIGVLCVVGAGYLWYRHSGASRSDVPGVPPASPVAAVPMVAAPTDNSIAVLPLVNESGDTGQQYFSDGLSEDLITALSQLSGLRVIGRNSSFQFRDSKDDSRTIGTKLGVAHLLEGTVRRSGNAVRISAELINTADGTTQWSERYDRQFRELFALQDDITRAVAAALKTRLLTAESTNSGDRPPSGNLDAYNALLQGQFFGARDTQADMEKAIEQFSTATRLDPRYALAWSLLARQWTGLGEEFLDSTAQKDANGKARAASATALSIAPDLAYGHIARGYILLNVDFDPHGAETEFRRAVELAPKDGEALFMVGNVLATLGQPDQALAYTQQALATDPLRARWHNWNTLYLLALNRLDEARNEAEKAIELQPDAAAYHESLVMVEIARGDSKAALVAAQAEPSMTWRKVGVALALQRGADRAAADASLHELIDTLADTAAFQIAEVYALRNEADKTFEWLDRSWSNRDPGINYLLFDPYMQRYRADPRMAAYCIKVGLPTPAQVAAGTSSAAAR